MGPPSTRTCRWPLAPSSTSSVRRSPSCSRHGWTLASAGAAPSTTRNGSPLGAGAGEEGPAVVAAEEHRGEVEHVPVDQTLLVEGVGHGGAALDEHLEGALGPELVEQVREGVVPLEAGMDAGAGRGIAEHNSPRAVALDVADGERRVVDPDGACADEDRVALGAQAMRVVAGGLAGDPLRRAVGCSGRTVEGAGDLAHDVRPAGPAVMQVRGRLALDGVSEHPDFDGKAGATKEIDPAP